VVSSKEAAAGTAAQARVARGELLELGGSRGERGSEHGRDLVAAGEAGQVEAERGTTDDGVRHQSTLPVAGPRRQA
jgi:hypothetical protein